MFPCRSGKFRLPYPGKAQQPRKQCYPFLSVCVVFMCSQTMARQPMFGIFNPHTDVKACDCTRRLYRHCMRVCTGNWLWEKNPCHTRDSNLHQFCGWLFNRTLFQLSYICPLREEPECNVLFPCAIFFFKSWIFLDMFCGSFVFQSGIYSVVDFWWHVWILQPLTAIVSALVL